MLSNYEKWGGKEEGEKGYHTFQNQKIKTCFCFQNLQKIRISRKLFQRGTFTYFGGFRFLLNLSWAKPIYKFFKLLKKYLAVYQGFKLWLNMKLLGGLNLKLSSAQNALQYYHHLIPDHLYHGGNFLHLSVKKYGTNDMLSLISRYRTSLAL